MASRKAGGGQESQGVEVALAPEELELDPMAMTQKYEEHVREQQAQVAKEDFSDMVAEHAAKQKVGLRGETSNVSHRFFFLLPPFFSFISFFSFLLLLFTSFFFLPFLLLTKSPTVTLILRTLGNLNTCYRYCGDARPVVAHSSFSPLRLGHAAKEEEGPAAGHQSWSQEIQGVQVLEEEEGEQQARGQKMRR